jgi:hydrogenase maturation protease
MKTTNEPNQKTGTCLVIGVGNAHRRDDGVGLRVAQGIKDKKLEYTTALGHHGEGGSLMDSWKQQDNVILIDAVRSGLSPGRIHRIDARTEQLPSDFFHYSTHAFSVAEAVELDRTLGNLPPNFIIYGIEGQDFSSGLGLSPDVAAAAIKVEAMILAELENLRPQSKGD